MNLCLDQSLRVVKKYCFNLGWFMIKYIGYICVMTEWTKAANKKNSSCPKATRKGMRMEQINMGTTNQNVLFMTLYWVLQQSSSWRSGNFKWRIMLLRRRITVADKWKGPVGKSLKEGINSTILDSWLRNETLAPEWSRNNKISPLKK